MTWTFPNEPGQHNGPETDYPGGRDDQGHAQEPSGRRGDRQPDAPSSSCRRFRIHLQAENKSARTIEAHCEAVRRLDEFLERAEVSGNAGGITKEMIVACQADLMNGAHAEHVDPVLAGCRVC